MKFSINPAVATPNIYAPFVIDLRGANEEQRKAVNDHLKANAFDASDYIWGAEALRVVGVDQTWHCEVIQTLIDELGQWPEYKNIVEQYRNAVKWDKFLTMIPVESD